MEERDTIKLNIDLKTFLAIILGCEFLALGLVTFVRNLFFQFGFRFSYTPVTDYIPSLASMVSAGSNLILAAVIFPILLARHWGVPIRRLVPTELPRLQIGFLFLMLAILLVWMTEEPVREHLALVFSNSNGVLLKLSSGYYFYIGVVLFLSPLIEEFFYRGYLQTFLTQYFDSYWAPVVLVSCIWSLIHWQGIDGYYSAQSALQWHLELAIKGVSLSVARSISGGIWLPFGMHMVFNFLVTSTENF